MLYRGSKHRRKWEHCEGGNLVLPPGHLWQGDVPSVMLVESTDVCSDFRGSCVVSTALVRLLQEIHICIPVCVYLRIYLSTYVFLYVSMYLLTCVSTCLPMYLSTYITGLSLWFSGKESACNAGDMGSIPGLGRSPEGGNVNPLQCSFQDNPMDRGD